MAMHCNVFPNFVLTKCCIARFHVCVRLTLNALRQNLYKLVFFTNDSGNRCFIAARRDKEGFDHPSGTVR